MKFPIETTCPYCKCKQKIIVNFENHYATQKVIVTCETEDGGCGSDYAIYAKLRVGFSEKKIA